MTRDDHNIERKKPILIVDSDEQVLIALEALLEDAGYNTFTAWRGREVVERVGPRAFALALVDEYLPDMDSKEILRRLKRMDIPAVVLRSGEAPQEAVDSVNKWALPAVLEAVRNRA